MRRPCTISIHPHPISLQHMLLLHQPQSSILHCNVLEALTRETLPNKIPSCYLVLLPGLIAMGPYVQLTTPLPIVVEVFPPPVLL